MSGRYFYAMLLGFVCGVAIASMFTITLVYIVYVVVLALVGVVVAGRRSEAPSARNIQLVSLFFLFIALGMIRFNVATFNESNPIYEKQLDTPITIEGLVTREPDIRANSTHLYVETNDELLLVKTNRYTNAKYGDMVSVQGVLEKPETFQTDLGRIFNYPKYLQARGVSYVVTKASVIVQQTQQGNVFIRKILALKQLFMEHIESIIPEPAVGLSEGLLLGVKRALGDELEAVFRATGIIHIVVLSGYNVTLVVLFVTYMLSFVLPFSARLPFGIGAIVAFAILVGLSPTVVRASIMAGLVLFARATGRTYTVMRALMFAGVVMLLVNPYLLVYDVGFQLSFVATLGLLLVAPLLERFLWFVPNILKTREFLVATISTQIFVLPLLLYSIGQFSLVSVLVNVLVLPMVPVAMLLTFITGIVSFLSPSFAVLVGYGTYISLMYIIHIATFFSGVPFASVTIPAFPFLFVVAGYTILGAVLYWLYQDNSDRYVQNEGNKDRSDVPKGDSEENIEQWIIEEEEVVRRRI